MFVQIRKFMSTVFGFGSLRIQIARIIPSPFVYIVCLSHSLELFEAPSDGRLRAAHVYLGINKDIVTHKHTNDCKHIENELKCFNFEVVCDHQTPFFSSHEK